MAFSALYPWCGYETLMLYSNSISCTDLENTTNLYKKFTKYQRYVCFTDGPASKEVPESEIETQPPTQKPTTKCS